MLSDVWMNGCPWHFAIVFNLHEFVQFSHPSICIRRVLRENKVEHMENVSMHHIAYWWYRLHNYHRHWTPKGVYYRIFVHFNRVHLYLFPNVYLCSVSGKILPNAVHGVETIFWSLMIGSLFFLGKTCHWCNGRDAIWEFTFEECFFAVLRASRC